MQLLADPHAWLSFAMLALLEIVLGVDNIIFLSVLVERLPPGQRGSARYVGLSFAMLTRIALLFSITWLATLRSPLVTLGAHGITGRDLILGAGGGFLIVKSVLEIREMLGQAPQQRRPDAWNGFWPIILQIALIDIVFSLDSVFTAVGLAQQIEVMVAAIVASVLVMMAVSGAVSRFIERYPTLKVLALAFLVLVGFALFAEAMDWHIPQGYLYCAMGFAAMVEWLNILLRRRQP